MKRLLSAVLIIIAFAGLVSAQSAQGVLKAASAACATAAECVTLPVNRNQSAGAAIQLSGSFSGTLTFEGTVDGGTWTDIAGSPAAGGIPAASTTSAGIWQFGLGGLVGLRARPSAYSSGSMNITIVGSSGSAASGAGGGGSGNVNIAQVGGTNVTNPLAVSLGTNGLPTAVLLADGLSLPTTPLIGAANLCYNGTTLDLCRSSTGGAGASDANTERVIIASDDTVARGPMTSGGLTGCYIVSAASTNSNNCKGSAGQIYHIRVVNTTSTIYYLRLYNASSAPTCSSATGFIESIPIPHSTGTGGGFMEEIRLGVAYGTGIGYCLTGGSSSTDNTNAATGIFGAIFYK